MERDLLMRYKTAHELVEQLETQVKSARAEEREAESHLIEYLETHRATATGKYDCGWAQIQAPRLYASATQEVWPQILVWLKMHGHESAVKETVHPSTLSQIVGELLRDGTPLPDGVTYYLKPNVRLYGG